MKIVKKIQKRLKTVSDELKPIAKRVRISDILCLLQFQTMFKLNNEEVNRISASMAKNGYDRSHPIQLWNRDGKLYLVDGHTRLVAAKQAGLSVVWAIVHDFATEDEAYRYALEQQLNRRNLSESEMLEAVAR